MIPRFRRAQHVADIPQHGAGHLAADDAPLLKHRERGLERQAPHIEAGYKADEVDDDVPVFVITQDDSLGLFATPLSVARMKPRSFLLSVLPARCP